MSSDLRRDCVLVGAGGHASVLREILELQDVTLRGYFAPTDSSLLGSVPWLGPDSELGSLDASTVWLVNGIGTVSASAVRRRVFEDARAAGFEFASVIDQTAIVRPSAQLGMGVQVLAGAIVNTGAVIGDNSIVNSGAIIEHHVRLGSHVHVSPGAALSGAVQIGDGSHIGIGARLLQGVSVGHNCTIGAGAVVIADVPDDSTAVGVPAAVRPAQ